MDEMLASAKKEVLVEMVKLAQKRQMAGSKGKWKEFLKVYDTKFGASLSDPARRNVDSLEAFFKTFSEENDLKFFKKFLLCCSNRDKLEEFKKISPGDETLEQKLVRETLQHPQYPIDYCFPSHEEEWLVTKCGKASKMFKSTTILAIDCEMVLCEDGTEALVKVCVVDRDLQVKLNEVVKPNKAIVDFRTEITGISAADLDGVTCTLVDVQKSMKRLLSHGTILIGHSLSNDLQTLKIDHTRVIDTSYLFMSKITWKKPSLVSLCKAVLGYDLREPGNSHNCLDDACAAMRLVLAKLDGKAENVVLDGMEEVVTGKLLIHRIPTNIHRNNLSTILSLGSIVEVKVTRKCKGAYSAFVIFKTQEEANEVFEKLEGDMEKDSYGYPQKLVTVKVKSGTYGLYVRNKSLDSAFHPLKSKRPADEEEEDITTQSKKSKSDQIHEQGETSDCHLHLEEIKRLKQELKQRDQEIANLNKIVIALTRKQGL